VVYGAGAVMAGAAQKNLPHTPATLESRIHVVAAALAGCAGFSSF
jgi:hypothetical protein